MSGWKYYRCCNYWSNLYYRSWMPVLLILVCITQVCAQCKDESLCSFMASEGECENDPEYMLEVCPRACKNPCLCPGISSDTACDCLVKAKEGYCTDPGAMADCQSTCNMVSHESCPLLPLPNDPNAQLSTWSTHYLTTVTEVCNVGYEPADPENQGKKICSSNRRWVTDPFNGAPVECTHVDCGPPPQSPNTFSVATDTKYGSTADYTCAKGYVRVQGQKTLTCNASGLWDGQILICKRVDCGQPLSSPNSSFKVTSTIPGGTASYVCAVGFQRVRGDTTLICSSTGVWQGSLIVCKVVDCGPPPSSSNAQFEITNTTYGSTATYTCMPGYVVVQGQRTLTCNASGIWAPGPPVCSKVNCGQPPSAANTDIVVSSTNYGDTANYTCATGYTYVQGNTTLTCGLQGTWNGVVISCTRVTCGQPPSASNAILTVTDVFYESKADYTCEIGYSHIHGDTSLTCAASGQWNGTVIICQRIDCGQPPSVAHTNLVVSDTLYGDTANYTCITGYKEVQGDSTLTCGTTGNWEGAVISCQRIDCGQPPTVANTNLVVSDTLYGDTANYTCVTGYKQVQGDSTLTCGASGNWEGGVISCQRKTCGQPPPAANTHATATGTSYGDTANYTCITGYRQVKGDTSLTCGESGSWEGVLIACQRIDCGQPPSVANAHLKVSDTLYGDTANYTCVTGYTQIQGDSTLTCGATGNWEGTVMSCQRDSCGLPPSVPNTAVTSSGTSFGDTANYTCQRGYVYVSGDMTLTCGSAGTWLGNPISCRIIDCGQPPAAAHTNLTVSGTSYWDTASYVCTAGYRQVDGDSYMTCGASGSWEGVLITCQRIDCGQPPSVAHTNPVVSDTLYGDTVNYTCVTGYKQVQGDSILTCGAAGNWEGDVMSCQRLDCGQPSSVAHTNLEVSDTLYGDTANYTCVTGYKQVQGDSTLTCGATGSWEGAVMTCQRLDCGQPSSVAHTNLEVSDTLYGDTANYTCVTGYKQVQGDSTLTCGATGSWEGAVMTCQRDSCGQPPSVPNAAVTSSGTSFGDTANYTCQTGYVYVSGDVTLTCGSPEAWLGAPIVCTRIDCGQPPSAENTNITVSGTFYGDTANYVCASGYRHVQGDMTFTCGVSGSWGGVLITCRRVDCGQPPSVANAHLMVSDTLYGDTANYTCVTGYKQVQGDSTLTCGASGYWEGAVISCQRDSCGQPPSVPNAAVTSSGTSYGDTANYTCQTGYVYVSGDVILTCGSPEAWLGAPVVCKRIDCGQPPPTANTNITLSGTFYGDTASYMCTAGYRYVQGDMNLTCGTSGLWAGVPISCQRIDCGQPPTVANTNLVVRDTLYGDTANYTCVTGYKQVHGDSTMTCGTAGTWDGVVISCQKDSCGQPPSIPNAAVTSSGTSFGDTVSYTCLTGYFYVSGDMTLTCGSSGTWLGTPIFCKRINCGQPPSAANAIHTITGTFYGDTITYTCAKGYTQGQGDTYLTCGSSGTWQGVPITCQLVVCGPAPAFEGARQWAPEGGGHLQYQDKSYYQCDVEEEGREGLQWVMECGPNKKWVGDEPQCGGNIPQKPAANSHGTMEAPAAWAIGVAIFALLATIIVVCVVFKCGSLRKHPMRKNVRNLRNDVADSLPSFRVWVKWRPNVVRGGRLVPASSADLPGLSPTPSVRSVEAKHFTQNTSLTEPNQIKSTYLTVSSRHSQLSPPMSTYLTSGSSLSIPKSPSSITLSSYSEPTNQNSLPNVGL